MKKINFDSQKLKDGYLGGCSIAQLAIEYNVSESTIWRHLHKIGVDTHHYKIEVDIPRIVQQYTLGMSLCAIGKDSGVSRGTIASRLRLAGISPRKRAPFIRSMQANCTYCNREWLTEQYHGLKRTQGEIARLCGVSASTIGNNMHDLNIPTREVDECAHKAQGNHVNLSPAALDLLDGLLFSDGCLKRRGKFSARYTHSDKHKRFILWLSETLKSYGIEQTGKVLHYTSRGKLGINHAYHYAGRSYEELVAVYERWYPKDKKRIPRDIVLTPTVLRMEYLGDGTLIHRQKGNPSIVIATCGFPKDDVLFFIDKLIDMGIEANYHKSSNSVYIGTKATKKFLNYISPLPLGLYEMYGYKVDTTMTKTEWEEEYG